MSEDVTVVIRFKDVENDDADREALEKRCQELAQEFPETLRYELTLSASNLEMQAHAHATGKSLDEAAHATAPDARNAGERALDKLERELRRHHDKKIFANRRKTKKTIAKRT